MHRKAAKSAKKRQGEVKAQVKAQRGGTGGLNLNLRLVEVFCVLCVSEVKNSSAFRIQEGS